MQRLTTGNQKPSQIQWSRFFSGQLFFRDGSGVYVLTRHLTWFVLLSTGGQTVVESGLDTVWSEAHRMRLDHVAVWTRDIDRLRAFYERYFGASAGARYESATRAGFISYFLTFPMGGARLELMSLPELDGRVEGPAVGYAHLAVLVPHRWLLYRRCARGCRRSDPHARRNAGRPAEPYRTAP